jgi:hypothetical protein
MYRYGLQIKWDYKKYKLSFFVDVQCIILFAMHVKRKSCSLTLRGNTFVMFVKYAIKILELVA